MKQNPKKSIFQDLKTKHSQSFARRLLKSHLLVASLGLFLLLFCLASTWYLRNKIVILAKEIGPSALTSAQVLGHVQHSLASLRGWVSLGDETFLVEWENAWTDGIEPAMASLIELRDEHKLFFAPDMLAQLRHQLTELQESQWWVLNVAQTPGNEPAAVTYKFDVEPIADTLDTIITVILYEMAKEDLADKETILRLLEIKRVFSLARILLEEITHKSTLYHEHEKEFYLNIDQVRTFMGELTSLPLFNKPELHRLSLLFQRELPAFEKQANKTIMQRKSDKWNVAQYRMAVETVPIAKQIVEMLSELATNSDIMMRRQASIAAKATTLSVFFMVILIGIMMLAATTISRRQSRALTVPIAALSAATQQIAGGLLDQEIPVRSSDEIGELTQAFNAMRASLKQAREKLLVANINLEHCVKKRTLELDTVNQDLRQEITERKQAEEQITASLKEKEVLLREIHHRTKNNMQVLITLLKLQSDNAKNEKFAGLLKESINRIKSMALIHEKLYRAKNLEYIDFKVYVNLLVNGLLSTYAVDSSRVTAVVKIENIPLGIDNAISCGLIINELVSNSLKHAFPEERQGEIVVFLCPVNENAVELTVGDNGMGMPKDLDFRKTETLGLHLVTILAEDQLDGKIDLDRTKGTRYHIRFNTN